MSIYTEDLASMKSRLVQLTYVSRATSVFQSEDLSKLIEVAQNHNDAHGLTGVLFYHNMNFLQRLEGAAVEVCKLFHTISQDTRHDNVVLLSYGEITERSFASWGMGLASASKVNQKIYLKYTPERIFSPYLLNEENVNSFLVELRDTAMMLEDSA